MTIDKNATIIDVRSPEEFSGQHVPGAINIPLDQLSVRMVEIKEMPKQFIVTKVTVPSIRVIHFCNPIN